MKKVVITGSSGFIGRHALPLLSQKGYEVYPLRLNLSDPQQTAAQLKAIKPDALLHFAWETTPGFYWHAPSNIDWLKCSLDLVENFVLSGGKRVVIAGSCAELEPSTLYGACKESLRLTSKAFLAKQDVSFAWGRIFSPYGPYEHTKRLIPSLIEALLEQEPFSCNAQDHVRDFLYVEDVAEAFVSLLKSGVEGSVDIGSGEGVKVGDLVKLVANKLDAIDSIQFNSADTRGDNPSSLIADASRLENEVGYQPKNSLTDGIEKTIEWWKHEIYH